jgi:hypothetical protein
METAEIITKLNLLQKEVKQLSCLLTNSHKTPCLPEQWLDIQEVCFLLKISKRTLFSLKSSGKLSFSQINGKVYFKSEDIQKFLMKYYVKSYK